MDTTVAKIYSRVHTPTGMTVLFPTVELILNSESQSPAKNRDRETWRQLGTASATLGMYHPSHPSYKYCQSRELFKGSLEAMHIIADPLLNEDRQECCQQAKGEGHEPENINMDIGAQWIKCRERGRRSGRNGNLQGDRGQLQGNLREDDRVLSEIIHCFICRAGLQILFAVNYECCESSREQTSLWGHTSVYSSP